MGTNRIAVIAAERHGNITRTQLGSSGLSRHEIARLTADGQLIVASGRCTRWVISRPARAAGRPPRCWPAVRTLR
jgi:hypothetical protein